MPTLRPRLTVTLTDEIDHALTAFADATETSKGQIIVEALEQMVPFMLKTATTMQMVRRMKPEALAQVKSRADSLEALLVGAGTTVQAGMDLFDSPPAPAASEHSERPKGRASVASKAAANLAEPPPPNRGVRNSGGKGKVTSIRSRIRG